MALSNSPTSLTVIMIKPSRYDSEGYPITWVRSIIPSNTLAALYGLGRDSARRMVLGENVQIHLKTYDETNRRIRPQKIISEIKSSGGKGLICLVGVQSNQFPRAVDLAKPFLDAGLQVALGGFHISGCISMLPELPPALGQAALKSLRARGVQVRLLTRAAAVLETTVHLAAGDSLATHTVISTIGTQPNALVKALGLPAERGRVTVAADLSVPGHLGIWALGDCALVPNAHDGKPAPPTAQFAVREGQQLADNLLAVLRGAATKPFNHRSLGAMASIGHMKGVAQAFGVPLSGLPAWLLWRAYYLSQMPTLRRKLRIFVEWTWGMFFPTDITHLRFSGSQALLEADRQEIVDRANGVVAPATAALR